MMAAAAGPAAPLADGQRHGCAASYLALCGRPNGQSSAHPHTSCYHLQGCPINVMPHVQSGHSARPHASLGYLWSSCERRPLAGHELSARPAAPPAGHPLLAPWPPAVLQRMRAQPRRQTHAAGSLQQRARAVRPAEDQSGTRTDPFAVIEMTVAIARR